MWPDPIWREKPRDQQPFWREPESEGVLLAVWGALCFLAVYVAFLWISGA